MYLNNHSCYSLRYGTLKIEELVQTAVQHSISKLALTDINNTTGVFDFVKHCQEAGIHPVAGMDLRTDNQHLYVALAKNNAGFSALNEFVSSFNLQKKPLPGQAPFLEDVYIIYPLGQKKEEALNENEFIGITPADITSISIRNTRNKNKYVIRHPVSFNNSKGYLLHQHLRAIDNNILLSRLDPGMMAGGADYMFSKGSYYHFYKDFPEAIQNTEQLLAHCEINFSFEQPKTKKNFLTSGKEDWALFTQLVASGKISRYGYNHPAADERVRKELEIIQQLGFVGYFLITWDLIQEAKRKDFYHVGRGSGANSIISYCLGITDVDPLELDLYFERFLNPKRSVPPDFDIDFSWKDRDHMFDYLFKKYGRKHVALLGTISTFKSNSFIRELGKVYGLPKSEIDLLADRPQNVSKDNMLGQKIIWMGQKMRDFPNIRSIHAGGVLIGEAPISCYSPVDMPPKGFPTVQFDMYVAELINFEKLDVLSQRGIGHIKDCAEIVKKNHDIDIDVYAVEKFKSDEKVRAQLKKGDTIGCFYIESPAMRQLLKKLHCDNFIHLVAASSIIRPGVASSGMMGQFIHRFHHQNDFEYLHPVLKEQLGETFGVMVYQEDVLKICHHYAGLDLGDADVLRRAMSGKYRSKDAFQQLVDKFFEGARALGRPEEITAEIWRQTSSFGGYSFCKAHSASFAVESFQSLYLKTYFPIDFMVAVINNFGGFYTSWVYVKEAIKCGANVHLPCINHSETLTVLFGKDIYLGFTHVQNFERECALALVKERQTNGAFKNLNDFVKRTGITREQLFILIKLGALRCFGNKKELFWEATLHINKEIKNPSNKSTSLFELTPKPFVLPPLEENRLEDAYDEIELLGFPVTLSEFNMLQTSYRGSARIEELSHYQNQEVRLVGNLVATKGVRAKNGKSMMFGTFLDEDLHFFDTVHFTQSLQKYPFTGTGVYLMEGKVVMDFGVPSIEIKKMARLPYKSDPREA